MSSMTKSSSPLKTAALVEAQGGKCAYCPAVFTTEEELETAEPESDLVPIWPTFDHVVPKSRQGRNGINNGLAACGPCNTAKGNRPPTKAELKLLAEIAPKALVIYARMTEELAELRMSEAGIRTLSRRDQKRARKAIRWQATQDARDEHLWPRSYRPADLAYAQREARVLTGRGWSI